MLATLKILRLSLYISVMVEFQDVDYLAIRKSIFKKLGDRTYFNGHIYGTTSEGVKYKLVYYIINFAKEGIIVPVWWEMFTYNEFGDSILNGFDFNELNL